MDGVEWVSTPESSRTQAVGYDQEAMRIYCRWSNGDIGFYDGPELSVWKEFLASDSKGRFVERRLKGSYPYSSGV